MSLTVRVLRAVESQPKSDDTALQLDHPSFLEGSVEHRRAVMHASSEQTYRDELEHPWDRYFAADIRPRLRGARALDLGCFTGGRSVAWAERYDFRAIAGVDIDPVYTEAAWRFTHYKQLRDGWFETGYGEDLPFAGGGFDAVLSFDVLEHVKDPAQVLHEVHRVLRPGGAFACVFPSYWQPFEHHLTHVTRAPALHWVFSGRRLVRAYHQILSERPDADWYNRASGELAPWERGHTLNGLTERRFYRMAREAGFRLEHRSDAPLGSVGRRSADPRVKAISTTARLAVKAGLRDLALHRVACLLVKS